MKKRSISIGRVERPTGDFYDLTWKKYGDSGHQEFRTIKEMAKFMLERFKNE